MTRVKVLVVEDEIIIADDICDLLTEMGYEVAEPAISYSEAVKTLQDFNPDIAIVDIHLSGKKDGIDLAAFINENNKIPFIILTSNTDSNTVEKAKTVNPSAYLVKPYRKIELFTSIEIAISNFEKQSSLSQKSVSSTLKNVLFIKQNHLFIKVHFDDILFIKADHVYLEIFSKDKNKFIVRGSLNDYINKLGYKFSRIHRGYIINLQHIAAIDHDFVKIENTSIPIGKNYREEFLKRINLVQ